MHACGPESKSIPGCNASRSREVILPFCFIIVRPGLKYCIHVWGSPAQERQEASLEEEIRGLENLSYEIR